MRSFTGMPNVGGTVHPYVEAQADTLPGQHDGTPLLARWMNELFGFIQAAMYGAGMTPDGWPECAGDHIGEIDNSQVLQAIQHMFTPPGTYVFLASATIPTYSRLLECNGQVITRSDYARLDDVVYVGDTLNATAPAFYRTSDAGGTTRSTTGNYLVLPDLRGQFLVGYDPSKTVDPEGDHKSIGGIYNPSLINHWHGELSTSTAGPPPSTTRVFGDDGVSIGLHIEPAADCGGAYDFQIGDPIIEPGSYYSDDSYSAPNNSPALVCITY